MAVHDQPSMRVGDSESHQLPPLSIQHGYPLYQKKNKAIMQAESFYKK